MPATLNVGPGRGARRNAGGRLNARATVSAGGTRMQRVCPQDYLRSAGHRYNVVSSCVATPAAHELEGMAAG